ncbi:hypothetical protein POM88_012868 [Heracleum sosnowskyi]|uniref:S-protein homolog n=1 Tax=Heracleum sosnowskyi TaxID=360622 RepID=A0AAD8N2V7_9APIA|nr:hypothetical protein POM88_012868 [Heracleum sosnowskyi]
MLDACWDKILQIDVGSTMKRSPRSSIFVSLLVIIVTFSLVNKHPTVFGKHNKTGGHHVDPGLVESTIHEAQPLPIVPPLPVTPIQVVLPNPGRPGAPRSDTTFDVIVINQASAGLDTVNVSCTPGGGPPAPLPPPDTCGPRVEPHLLKIGERFSWTFEYPDARADISYMCRIDWTGHNQGLVSFFDKDSYTDAICRSNKGNFCYWTIAPDGFYHSNEDAPFPGPAWTYRWPWGV